MLTVVKTMDDAMAFKRWISEGPAAKSVACDTETSGVNQHDPNFKIRLIQFGTSDEAWVIPFERWIGLVTEVIERYRGRLIFHNSRFDIMALTRHGIYADWSRCDDTMIAIRLAEPTMLAGLKPASMRHVSASAGGSQKDLADAMKKNKWDWATVPIDFWPYVYYAAMDTVITHRLAHAPGVQAGFNSPVYDLEMEVRHICSIMEDRGMRIDPVFSATTADRLRAEAEELQDSNLQRHGFNLTSTSDLSHWLMSNGAKITKMTDGGKPSVDKESLEEVILDPGLPAETRNVIAAALRVRKNIKMSSSYFDNFISMADANDVVHPSIETVAAKTGRMSIREPALQTLPRVSDDPDSKLVRNAVIPRTEDELLVSSDYDQIELRIVASLSQDPGLIEAFQIADSGDVDFFTMSARQVYGDETIIKSDYRRPVIKSLFYAASYGAGVTKMAQTAGISVSDMQSVKDRVFNRYPGLGRLIKESERKCKDNDGWVETIFGRRLYVKPELAYKANNAIIQGTAADVLKRALVNMANAGLEDFMVVPVHDEILSSVPRDEKVMADVRHETELAMADYSMSVPLTAGPSEGYESWGAVPK